MLTSLENIQRSKAYSEEMICALRIETSKIASEFPASTMVAVGSLARKEASAQSDLDYFVVFEGKNPGKKILTKINDVIRKIGLRPPSLDGAFAVTIEREKLLATIGGADESNGDLTKRMLLLLESEWIFGESIYSRTFDGVIQRYIRDGITQHQLARFFLNDLIRYYRTICVDFEYKTGNSGKSWGDRNIKIMFSRKLLYFSGVIAAAETAQSAGEFKRTELTRLLKLTPIDRLVDVCGIDSFRAMKRYDEFLGWMSEIAVRELLRKTTSDRNEHCDIFRGMKNSGHHFSWELESLLHRRYAPTHPIFQALLL